MPKIFVITTMQTIRPPAQVGDDDDTATVSIEPTDEIFDLTDRRRVLLRLLFGVDVHQADAVFAADGPVSRPR